MNTLNLPYLTLTYREVDGLKIELDLYLPITKPDSKATPRPTLVYFHGGGLAVGDKKSWFPVWLYERTISAGFAFVSADYQLLAPPTGHNILEDIKSLFSFLEDGINQEIVLSGRNDVIDSERIAVAGTSGGGLCAYLAGIHAKPKPKAVLSMYGMGGDFFTSHYLSPKTKPFFRGRELLDPSTFSNFIHGPHFSHLPRTSSSQLSYHGAEHIIPGYPSNPRMLLTRLYLQLGNFLDYYTGENQPSISESLREHLQEDGRDRILSLLIPPIHHALFPQLNISAFPPTYLIHGEKDTAVPCLESEKLLVMIQSNGILAKLARCDGCEHSFDYLPNASQQWGNVFDDAFAFVKTHLFGNKN